MLEVTAEVTILNCQRVFDSQWLLINKSLPDIPAFEWL